MEDPERSASPSVPPQGPSPAPLSATSGTSADPLLARLRSGDDAAFADCVRVHGPRMLAAARRLLRDEHAAEDAVQDAFLSAFRGIDRFDGRAALGTWLHRIAVNAALARIRRAGSRPEESLDGLQPVFRTYGHFEEPPAPLTLPASDEAEREETRRAVRAAIDRLPETARTVVLLRDVEGLSTEETAAALGIEPGTAKVRLHRARLALRTLLAAREPDLR